MYMKIKIHNLLFTLIYVHENMKIKLSFTGRWLMWIYVHMKIEEFLTSIIAIN